MSLDLVTIGQLIVDIFVKPVHELPPLGQGTPVDRVSIHPGGCACNAARAGARLGGAVAALGKVGADEFGAFLKQEMTREGVYIDGIVESPDVPTAACVLLMTETAQRRSLVQYGAMAALRAEDINRAILHRARALHVGGIYHTPLLLGDPLADLLADARAHNLMVSVDTQYNWRGPHLDALRKMLPHVDYLFISMDEAPHLTGLETVPDISRFFLDMGTGTVIIKSGEGGSHLCTAGGCLHIPAYRVEVLDTTGAGDCMAAGFAISRLRGYAPEDAVRFGTATAACCIAAVGTTTGLLTFAGTETFMRECRTYE